MIETSLNECFAINQCNEQANFKTKLSNSVFVSILGEIMNHHDTFYWTNIFNRKEEKTKKYNAFILESPMTFNGFEK